MADGRYYHFEYGVFDRTLAGYRPSSEHIEECLPAQLKYVVYYYRVLTQQMPEYLPGFTRAFQVHELTDFTPEMSPCNPAAGRQPGAEWLILERERRPSLVLLALRAGMLASGR
jgi:hypothetical protein